MFKERKKSSELFWFPHSPIHITSESLPDNIAFIQSLLTNNAFITLQYLQGNPLPARDENCWIQFPPHK